MVSAAEHANRIAESPPQVRPGLLLRKDRAGTGAADPPAYEVTEPGSGGAGVAGKGAGGGEVSSLLTVSKRKQCYLPK